MRFPSAKARSTRSEPDRGGRGRSARQGRRAQSEPQPVEKPFPRRLGRGGTDHRVEQRYRRVARGPVPAVARRQLLRHHPRAGVRAQQQPTGGSSYHPPDCFQVLGIRPVKGRKFTPSDLQSEFAPSESAERGRRPNSPSRSGSSRIFLVLRASIEPSALAAQARRELEQIDASLPVFSVRTMDEVIGDYAFSGFCTPAQRFGPLCRI